VLDAGLTIGDSDYFAEYKAKYIARLMGGEFSGKVLDFGCGIGSLLDHLSKALPEIILHGYDISNACLEAINPAHLEKGLFTSDMERLDPDYDLIIMAGVIHHISEPERVSTLRALKKHMRRGGRLVIFEHNPANFLTLRVVERCPFDTDAVLARMSETRGYFESAGMRVLKSDYIVFLPPFFRRFIALERFLSWCALGAQYVVTGEKTD